MRVATKPALTRGLSNPPLCTPDLLAWKCPNDPKIIDDCQRGKKNEVTNINFKHVQICVSSR